MEEENPEMEVPMEPEVRILQDGSNAVSAEQSNAILRRPASGKGRSRSLREASQLRAALARVGGTPSQSGLERVYGNRPVAVEPVLLAQECSPLLR